jgi:hypothetical protein
LQQLRLLHGRFRTLGTPPSQIVEKPSIIICSFSERTFERRALEERRSPRCANPAFNQRTRNRRAIGPRNTLRVDRVNSMSLLEAPKSAVAARRLWLLGRPSAGRRGDHPLVSLLSYLTKGRSPGGDTISRMTWSSAMRLRLAVVTI